MKQAWIIIILVCILSACTPTPLPCDPCAEIDALSTRVAILEGETQTPTLPPTATSTPSSSPSRTATRTATPTFTPAVIPTQTPTGTHLGYVLEVAADPIQQIPSRRVTFTIAWDGPAAELRLNLPAQTCCPIPDPARWMVEGSGIVTATVLMNSTASGAKMFQAVAYVGGTIVKTDTVWVEVIAAGATATPTIGPTATPGGTQALKAGTWYEVRNPVSEMICLKVESGGALRGDKRLYWQDQEFWTWIEFRPGPGWRCFCGTFYWGGQRKATLLLFIFGADVTISDCRLCTWIQFADLASGRGVSGATCEVRG